MNELGSKINRFISEKNLNSDERLQLLDDLYWADWNLLNINYPKEVNELLEYLRANSLGIKEMAQTLSLYNNLSGAYIKEFSDIIVNFYKKDRIKFFKALNLNSEQSPHLVYIFRADKTFEDEDKEFKELLSTNKLTNEEIDAANSFFNLYRIVSTT